MDDLIYKSLLEIKQSIGNLESQNASLLAKLNETTARQGEDISEIQGIVADHTATIAALKSRLATLESEIQPVSSTRHTITALIWLAGAVAAILGAYTAIAAILGI